MKSVILGLIAFASISAFGHNNIRYEWVAINGLMVNNACVAGDEFRSLKDVKTCTETEVVSRQACRYGGEVEVCRHLRSGESARSDETVREQTRCAAYESAPKVVSRTYQEVVCVNYEKPSEESPGRCLETALVSKYAPTTFHIAMYQDYRGEAGEVYIGTKKFTVPNCQ